MLCLVRPAFVIPAPARSCQSDDALHVAMLGPYRCSYLTDLFVESGLQGREACATREPLAAAAEVEKNAEPLRHYLAAGEARKSMREGTVTWVETFIPGPESGKGGRRNSKKDFEGYLVFNSVFRCLLMLVHVMTTTPCSLPKATLGWFGALESLGVSLLNGSSLSLSLS